MIVDPRHFRRHGDRRADQRERLLFGMHGLQQLDSRHALLGRRITTKHPRRPCRKGDYPTLSKHLTNLLEVPLIRWIDVGVEMFSQGAYPE